MRLRRPQGLLFAITAVAAAQLLAACPPKPLEEIKPIGVSAKVASHTCTEDGKEVEADIFADCSKSGFDPSFSFYASTDGRTATEKKLEGTFSEGNDRVRFTAPAELKAVIMRVMCSDGVENYPLQLPACNGDGDPGTRDAGLGDAGVPDATAADANTSSDAVSPQPDASTPDAAAPDAGPSLLGYAYTASGPLSGVGDGEVRQYKAMSDGTLVAMSPASLPAGSRPSRVEVATIGAARFLYATNTGSDTVSQFSIGADGKLTALSPATVPVQLEPDTLRVVGSNLYVVNTGSRSISQFSIGTDGRLTALTPASVATGTAANGTNPAGICELGNRVYVASSGGTEGVTVYSMAAGGALSALGNVATVSGGYTGIVCSPNGTHLYTVGSDLKQFARSGDTLAPLSPASVTVPFGVNNLAFNRAGTKLFTSNFVDLALGLFEVAGTGALSAMTPASVSTLESPNAVTFDPTGTYFYVSNANGVGISTYTVSAMGGGVTLTPTGRADLGIKVIAP